MKYLLSRAQQRIKKQPNKHWSDRQFEVGTSVYVKLQPYRKHSITLKRNQKLGSTFFEPFRVIAQVEAVAYRLELPVHAKIHPYF